MTDNIFGELAPGVHVDHFELQRRIGGGASGEVWQAHDTQRHVAIKFMNTGLLLGDDAPRHMLRFQDEIRALEKMIDVPNVPTLYGYNLHHERPYLVMAYIPAPPWSSLIASGEVMALTLLERLRLLDVMAATITAVHERGVIHRDIKPANIHDTQHPYLVDFSVAVEKARAYDAEPNVGTGLYMPPPDDRPPDELTDNFAFALVAYEMLFGQHAVCKPETLDASFAEIRQLMQARLQGGDWHKPTTLSAAELPGSLRGADLAALDAVFGRALGRRARRYADLRRFMGEVRRAVTVADNQPYLTYVPELPDVTQAHTHDYTRHQVRGAHQHTDHEESGRWSRTRLAAVFFVVLWLVAAATVFVSVLTRAF